jgi:hypothetical protein
MQLKDCHVVQDGKLSRSFGIGSKAKVTTKHDCLYFIFGNVCPLFVCANERDVMTYSYNNIQHMEGHCDYSVAILNLNQSFFD